MAWLLDLDGTVWRAGEAIAGAPEAVAALRAGGERVLFVTNNSSATVAEQEASLLAIGIPAEGDVVTSAHAAARLLPGGAVVLVCGGAGIVEAIERMGGRTVVDGDADAVLVGFHRDFDYERLRIAATAVRRGARLIGTNDDATYPTPAGEIPGGGAILAAVATAAETTAVVAGKPYAPMVDAVVELVGPGPHVVVGDRPSTDGAFARRLGATFVLVLTGVTAAQELPVAPMPDLVVADLAEAVRALTGSPT